MDTLELNLIYKFKYKFYDEILFMVLEVDNRRDAVILKSYKSPIPSSISKVEYGVVEYEMLKASFNNGFITTL